MSVAQGLLEQWFAKTESAYAASAAAGGEVLSATDAVRPLSGSLTSKKNREQSPERHGTPDAFQSLPRRQTSNFNIDQLMWEPSGTLGTISNQGKFLEACLGQKHAIVAGLNTTIASGASATGATLTSATGLAVGDIIVVTVGGVRQATRIKTLAGAVVTWDALTASPDVPGQVTAGITFQLASSIAQSMALYRYNPSVFQQAVFGAVMDQLEVNFDGSAEVLLALQGPAGQYADSSSGGGTIQAKPGAFTTVGAPASGLVGSFCVDGNTFLVTSAKVKNANNLSLRNSELGTLWPSGILGRTDFRAISVELSIFLEDLRLIGYANSVTKGVLRCLIGSTNGSMLAAVLPSVEFEIPDIGNEVGPKQITINGIAYAVSGNDALFLAEI